MRRYVCIFLALLTVFFTGCSTATHQTAIEIVEYKDYQDIPGVTAEEIEAIERIRASDASFVFGMPEGMSCFWREDNVMDGYSVLLCRWLSELFGIKFTPAIYEWDELIDGVNSCGIQFTGALPSSSGFEIYKTEPIDDRVIITVSRDGDESFAVTDGSRLPVFGFIEGSGAEDVIGSLAKDSYTAVQFPTYKSAYDRLVSGELDAIYLDSDAETVFSAYQGLKIKTFAPAVHNMVSLSTADQDLEPVISVVQKYLESNAAYKLSELQAKGHAAYLGNELFKLLDDDERRYLKLHQNPAAVIPIAIVYDDYPNSFYNEQANEWQGITMDIIEQIEAITGFTFGIANSKNDNWSTVMAMIEDGTVALTGELIRTPEREGRFLWADTSYQTDHYALLSGADFPDVNIRQVNHLRVGVMANTAYAEIFYELFPNHPDTVVYNNNEEGFNALSKGEIDLLMATRNLLLDATNYKEMTGIKANIILDRTYDSQFGFNIKEKTLCSIISKAQNLIDTDSIIDRWIRRVFDYRGTMARAQVPYLVAASAMMVLALFLLVVFLFNNRRMGKRLEKTVDERTQELRARTAELEVQTHAAKIASQAKSEFLARMSHEIRTPMNAIIGMTRIALNSSPNEKIAGSLNEILTASEHLLGILNDVLDMSKIESGKFVLSESDFALRTAMIEVKHIMDQRCEEKNIDFSINFEYMEDYGVTGDKLRLKQVLINLLGNAVKFTPENGTIAFIVDILSADESTVNCRFTVSDSGIGMTETQMGKLFAMFEQADASIAERFGGTGLGLAISQNLVKYMGGEITVTSTQGEGATFTFTLSMPKADLAEEEADVVGCAPPDLTGKRLLVVDDIDINRLILIELLSETNVETEEACNGKEAFDMFHNAPENYYDLILMDVQMPIMDGYQTTMALRSSDRPDAKTVPIVAMTANAYREDIDHALESGMNCHLAKPVDVGTLMSTLRSFLCPEERT